jgi:glycosyltransferase involved in cell wall biosynthesis
MTAPPLVSFCVPTYRRAGFLRGTLNSALTQTFTDFEIVVVDDCSPDETAAVVAGIDDDRVRYIRNATNVGVPENLNVAVGMARGSFVVLLEDHDLLEPTYLEEALRVMTAYPTVGFVATGIVAIDARDQPTAQYVEAFAEYTPGQDLLRRLFRRIDCPFSVTTLIRKTCLDAATIPFDPKYGWYADQYLWLRLLAIADFGYVAKPLLRWRERENDHYLADREWESLLCLDRIRRDNWALLYREPTLASTFAKCRLEWAKLREAVVLRWQRRLANRTWSASDDAFLRAYLGWLPRLIAHSARLVPVDMISGLRAWHRARQSRIHAVDSPG